jgi:hypothetical protein
MFFNGGVKNKKAPAPVQEAAVSRNAVKLPNYCALLALYKLSAVYRCSCGATHSASSRAEHAAAVVADCSAQSFDSTEQ